MIADESSAAAFWNGVFAAAESIGDRHATLADVAGYLRGLVEGGADAYNPAEQFPEFATLALARAICTAIERSAGTDPSRA